MLCSFRNRQAGDSKYAAKLSMDELKCFSEQVQSLPCKIKESTLVGELLDSVKNFQAEAQGALAEETPDSEKLQRLLDLGITLDVDLPEVPSLKQVSRDISFWNLLVVGGSVSMNAFLFIACGT